MQYSELERRIEGNKSIDFGNILSKSIELFKKTWQQGLVHMLLSFALVFGVMIVVMIPFVLLGVFDPSVFQDRNPDPEKIVLMYVTMYLTMLPAIFVASAFTMLINAAFFRMIKQFDTGLEESRAVSFGMFFKGRYIKKAFVLSLATTFIALVAMLACVLPLYYVMVPITLLGVVFAFNPEMEYKEMLRASFKLGHKKWLITFGLMLVGGLIAQLGIILCGIGVFVTASFVYLPTYYIYKDSIGFSNEDHIDEIGIE